MSISDFLEASKKDITPHTVVMAHSTKDRGYSIVQKKNRPYWQQRGWVVVHAGPAVTAPKGVKRSKKGEEDSAE